MGRSMDRIMAYFEKISDIPRCSKDEARVAAWIKQWAEENHFAWKADAAENLVVQVPGRGVGEQMPPIILQGHMDMVCEKTPHSPHDFKKDPLRLITEGEWLHADGTTLGADNGIALALAMAAAADETLVHPPLELLFTVDEETGLTGADKLAPDMLTGKVLINMDSEIEGTFILGCAGGQDVEIRLPVSPEALQLPVACWEITVGGLHGGHSGVDIHRNRANANLVLAHTLMTLGEAVHLRLQAFDGGSAHNAIPRDARALIIASQDDTQALQDQLARCERRWQATFAQTDAKLRLNLQSAKPLSSDKALNKVETRKALDLILSLPHGVAGLSTIWPGVVETSANLARVRLDDGRLVLMCSLRSSDMSRLDEMTTKVSAVAHLADAQIRLDKRYPAWEVDLDSDLLARCRRLYADLFSEAAKVEVMHAGLECGVIGAKYAGMEMISIGPTLEHPHSPQERLYLPSVEKVWCFLKALLEDYAAQ